MSEFWSGLGSMVKVINETQKRTEAGGRKGLRLAGRHVLNVSNKQVPHEEGDLERDGAVNVDAEAMQAVISYGRRADTAKYAEAQHERLDYKHDGGRNAKFLENAMNSEKDAAAAIIQQAIKSEVFG